MPEKKRLVRGLLIAVAAVALLICAGCCVYIYQYYRGIGTNAGISDLSEASLVQVAVETVKTLTPAEDGDAEAGAPEAGETPAAEAEMRSIEIPVDFEDLEGTNGDIYAWIQVPGTVIDYPVLQSETDGLFYNNHSSDGAYYTGGAIFSQAAYNDKGFDAPMTLLYGHNLRSGNMFSQLNNFADALYFDGHREIYIYTPDRVYRYVIFAAYVHGSEHLLANHDFSDPAAFEKYFDGVYADAGLYDNFLEGYAPESGDVILTLSTCCRGNNRQRFLVQGVLVEVMRVIGPGDGDLA